MKNFLDFHWNVFKEIYTEFPKSSACSEAVSHSVIQLRCCSRQPSFIVCIHMHILQLVCVRRHKTVKNLKTCFSVQEEMDISFWTEFSSELKWIYSPPISSSSPVKLYSAEDESTSKSQLLPHKHDIITLLGVGGHWITTEKNLQVKILCQEVNLYHCICMDESVSFCCGLMVPYS